MWMSGASGIPDTPQRDRNNIPDLLRAIPLTKFEMIMKSNASVINDCANM